jgi:F-type H+-transporting ATPase subunit delta
VLEMYEYLDRRYALALYQVAEEKGKVEEYIQILKEIVELIEANKDLYTLISHPEISTSKKKKTFIKLFKGRMDEEFLSFLLFLIDKDRILYLKEKLNEMEKIHLEKNNTLLAQVKTVIPLQEEEKALLIEKLQRMYGKKIVVKEELDKELIGGVYVRIGNDVIDGTLKTKLAEMKKLMLKGEQR